MLSYHICIQYSIHLTHLHLSHRFATRAHLMAFCRLIDPAMHKMLCVTWARSAAKTEALTLAMQQYMLFFCFSYELETVILEITHCFGL